jgi:hypothetical protein
MRTPEQSMLFEQSQIAPNGLGGNCQLGGEFGDIHLTLPARDSDDLVLPFFRVHIRTSGRPTLAFALTAAAVDHL